MCVEYLYLNFDNYRSAVLRSHSQCFDAKNTLNSVNVSSHSIQNPLASSLLSKIHRAVAVPFAVYASELGLPSQGCCRSNRKTLELKERT
jgi:hypothetical protein